MYDSAFNDQLPAGGDAYAGYVDGHVGDQPNYDAIVKKFPKAQHLSISVLGNDADCLDIEAGAAAVASAPGWWARQRARGVARPVFYASASVMDAVIFGLNVARVPRTQYRLWSAHYKDGKHICGPATCRLMSQGADGTQWDDVVGGLTADVSMLAANFFDNSPSHMTVREGDMGPDVAAAQDRLNTWGASPKLAVDGDFGVKTLAAVKTFQKQAELTQDGVVGPDTWAALEKNPPPPPAAPTGLKLTGVSVTVTWDPFTAPGSKTPAKSYTVQAVQMNGKVAVKETTETTSCLLAGLVPGWEYDIQVWTGNSGTVTTHVTA